MTREAVRRYALVRFTKVILEVEAAAGARDPRLRVDDDLRPDDPRSHCRRQREQCALREAARIGDELRLPHCFPDRKSTRLNSSHPSISYAVFCLKKKTK